MNRLPKALHRITTLAKGDRYFALGITEKNSAPETGLDPIESETNSIWRWTARSREVCHRYLHYFSRIEQFYHLETLNQSIANSVFADADHIPPQFLRSFVHSFLQTFVTNCPTAAFSALNLPMLLSSTQYLNGRLLNMKSLVVSEAAEQYSTLIYRAEHDEEEDITDEIAYEWIARMFFRGYAEFWGALFANVETHGKKGAETAAPKSFKHPELVRCIFSSPVNGSNNSL
jgi:Exportin-5 family